MEWALLFILQWNGMLWKGANPLFQISCLSSIRREVWNKSVRFSFKLAATYLQYSLHTTFLSAQTPILVMLEKHPVLSLIIYFALNNRWLQLSSEDILQENTWNQTRADDNKYGYVYIWKVSFLLFADLYYILNFVGHVIGYLPINLSCQPRSQMSLFLLLIWIIQWPHMPAARASLNKVTNFKNIVSLFLFLLYFCAILIRRYCRAAAFLKITLHV